jgi:hypothetical protein
MIHRSDYPQNGYLVEWSEQQQAFFVNEVRNRQSDKQTNVNGVVPVAICDTWNEANLIITFVEDLLNTRGALAYGKRATTREVELFIKKMITFSQKHTRFLKKKNIA